MTLDTWHELETFSSNLGDLKAGGRPEVPQATRNAAVCSCMFWPSAAASTSKKPPPVDVRELLTRSSPAASSALLATSASLSSRQKMPHPHLVLALVLDMLARAVANAYAAPPPPAYGMPPWAPGAMPPVPGPVCPKSCQATIGICIIGCIFLGANLLDTCRRLNDGSYHGQDNELLTRGGAGNAAWMKSIEQLKGKNAGHCSSIHPVPEPKSSRKSKGKSRHDDEELQELRPPRSKSSGSKKNSSRR